MPLGPLGNQINNQVNKCPERAKNCPITNKKYNALSGLSYICHTLCEWSWQLEIVKLVFDYIFSPIMIIISSASIFKVYKPINIRKFC